MGAILKVRDDEGNVIDIPVLKGKDGKGDMETSVYDPQGKKQDVFKYIEQKVDEIPKIDAYTKEETLSEETKSAFGLSAEAVPDDVFAKLAERSTNSGGGNVSNIVFEKIRTSQTWTAPKAVDQLFRVYAVGGGGGGGTATSTSYGGGMGTGGGGGGYVSIGNFQIEEGTPVDVVCGAGGNSGSTVGVTGGTTSFGSMLTAEGGKGGYGYKNNGDNDNGGHGGDGGAGGGAGACYYARGGNGGTYGGGGGGSPAGGGAGGNGGTYGGGGSSRTTPGQGGTYGGNGGKTNVAARDGKPFADPLVNVFLSFDNVKDSSGGASAQYNTNTSYGGGGGGYGGRGGNGKLYGGAGGGGYCGNGGEASSTEHTANNTGNGSGGGGGFCSNGRSSDGPNGGGGGGLLDMGIGGNGGLSGQPASNAVGVAGGVIIVYFKEEE